MSWYEMYESVRFLPRNMAKRISMEEKEEKMEYKKEANGGITYKKVSTKKPKKAAKKSKMK